MKHVMAITYNPKIQAVLDGSCRQTIRKGLNVSAGDEILFHGWEGRPYRSKWSWRLRVVVSNVYNIKVSDYGIQFFSSKYMRAWWSPYVEHLAKLDFISPATGEELKNVLFGLNGAPKTPQEYQIVRWW